MYSLAVPPLQLRETVPLNPPWPPSQTVKLAVCPALMVTTDGKVLLLRAKSMPVPWSMAPTVFPFVSITERANVTRGGSKYNINHTAGLRGHGRAAVVGLGKISRVGSLKGELLYSDGGRREVGQRDSHWGAGLPHHHVWKLKEVGGYDKLRDARSGNGNGMGTSRGIISDQYWTTCELWEYRSGGDVCSRRRRSTASGPSRS
jgi:hypothetical protein